MVDYTMTNVRVEEMDLNVIKCSSGKQDRTEGSVKNTVSDIEPDKMMDLDELSRVQVKAQAITALRAVVL